MAALAAVPSFAGSFSNPPSSQSHQQSRSSQMPRALYSNAVTGYRPNAQPTVAPYAFTSTPNLTTAPQPSQQQQALPNPRQENRPPPSQSQVGPNGPPAPRQRAMQPSTLTSTLPPSSHTQLARDDSSLVNQQPKLNPTGARPASTINLISLVPSGQNAAGKPSPDRYRRNHRRPDTGSPSTNGLGQSAMPSGSGMATVGHLYKHPNRASSSPSLHSLNSNSSTPSVNYPQANGQSHGSSDLRIRNVSDDMQLHRRSTYDQALNYRRRSVSSLEAAELASQDATQITRSVTADMAKGQRPASSHGRHGSGESSTSGRSGSSHPASVKKEQMTYAAALQSSSTSGQEQKPSVIIPPRGSSDVTKRLATPSPLSRPSTVGNDAPRPAQAAVTQPKMSQPQASKVESPAQQHLAALTERENKKGVKSRLRRAFSFGSAAELRRASAENSMNNNANAERAKLRKERPQEGEDAEQAAIAQKQEAGGIGESIYSGQGGFFTGSTDNLSISSTASSASIMIRKMGKGMKKSSRSLVGLFRPKSVYGDSGPDLSAPEPSVAQVSMVTVEAEREKVNVNANPHDQAGGGTGFPHLERNSLDAARVATSSRDGSEGKAKARQSIIGGERDRAEVLSSMKKGILKRTGTDSGNSSPIVHPADKPIDFNLPQIPHVNDTPGSSAPSTPRDERPTLGHRRTDSVTIEGEDYFMGLQKLNGGEDTKSLTESQQAMAKYNVSFSPRIQFHDTWPSLEYDRRGEIATCNRLTPMLAQQIKEELNTFKMEMEVHEQSKVYTHFF